MKTCKWLSPKDVSGIMIRDNGRIYPCCIRWVLLAEEIDKYADYNSISLEDVQGLRSRLLEEINEGKHPECQNCSLLYETDNENAKVGPIKHLIYHPHTLCSLNCTYCYYTDEQRSIPIASRYKDLYKTIKHFYDIGLLNKETFAIDLGGGEPLLLDNIDKTIEFMSNTWTNSTFYLLSNSTIEDKVNDFISKTKNKYENVNKVLITSIDAGTQETYKTIRKKDYYWQVAENLYNYATNDIFNNIILKYIFLDDGSNADDENIFGFLRLCRMIADNQKGHFQISLDIDWSQRKYDDSAIPEQILNTIGKMYYIIREIMEIDFIFASDYLSGSTHQGILAMEKVKKYAEEYKKSPKAHRDKYELRLLKNNSIKKHMQCISQSNNKIIELNQKIIGLNNNASDSLVDLKKQNLIQEQKLNNILSYVEYQNNRINFLQWLFSVRNENKHKVIRIFGFKFKIKRINY